MKYLWGVLLFRRRTKYGAMRTADGFPSKLERAVFYKLKDREVLGEIKDIQRQSVVVLVAGDKKERINWKVDFKFERNGEVCYAEAKGFETGEYRLKLRLWRKMKPARLEIWKGNWRYPKLVEVIEC